MLVRKKIQSSYLPKGVNSLVSRTAFIQEKWHLMIEPMSRYISMYCLRDEARNVLKGSRHLARANWTCCAVLGPSVY
jgi:hypothetical protein